MKYEQHIELASHLRNMPPKDISKVFDISEDYARVVKAAAKHIRTLLDYDLRIEAMANNIGVSVNTVRTYRSALRAIGISDERNT